MFILLIISALISFEMFLKISHQNKHNTLIICIIKHFYSLLGIL